jgi:hypothetical protein
MGVFKCGFMSVLQTALQGPDSALLNYECTSEAEVNAQHLTAARSRCIEPNAARTVAQ